MMLLLCDLFGFELTALDELAASAGLISVGVVEPVTDTECFNNDCCSED
jgi:hypothetical protein